MYNLEICLRSLLDLLNSDRPLTPPAPVDDMVDLYLAGSGPDKALRRIELADTFHRRIHQSAAT
jgi:hypothetical protein